MTLSSGLRRLATVVDDLEAADIDVEDATIEPASDGGHVRATVELSLAVDPPAAGTEITLDGTLDDPDETDGAADETGDGDATDDGDDGADASADGAAAIPCPEPDCDATFESEPGMKVHRTKVHLSGSGEGDGVPAYRDPDRLATVYEAEDTFPAMRDALDADVSAQTIRRHMIRHGIHDPEADDEAASQAADAEAEGVDDGSQEAEEETPRALTDGAALADVVPADIAVPDGLELGDLRDGVEAADTLYGVQRRFDLDRETTRDLLAAFDLLELVHGRVATKGERERLKDEIDRRIRTNLADAPAP